MSADRFIIAHAALKSAWTGPDDPELLGFEYRQKRDEMLMTFIDEHSVLVLEALEIAYNGRSCKWCGEGGKMEVREDGYYWVKLKPYYSRQLHTTVTPKWAIAERIEGFLYWPGGEREICDGAIENIHDQRILGPDETASAPHLSTDVTN